MFWNKELVIGGTSLYRLSELKFRMTFLSNVLVYILSLRWRDKIFIRAVVISQSIGSLNITWQFWFSPHKFLIFRFLSRHFLRIKTENIMNFIGQQSTVKQNAIMWLPLLLMSRWWMIIGNISHYHILNRLKIHISFHCFYSACKFHAQSRHFCAIFLINNGCNFLILN